MPEIVSDAWRLEKINSIHACQVAAPPSATPSPPPATRHVISLASRMAALRKHHHLSLSLAPLGHFLATTTTTFHTPLRLLSPHNNLGFKSSEFSSKFVTTATAMAEEGALILSSKGISNGGRIPRKYTQDGQGAVKDVSPPLEWYNLPEGTESLAIIMEDPDSPDPADPSPNPFVHWVVANIPPTLKGLPEGFTVKDHDDDKDDASEILEGGNDFKSTGYSGPVPSGSEHRYEFHLYALDAKLKVPKKPSRDRLLEAMDGHILEEAQLVATFGSEHAGHNNYLAPGLPNLSGPGRANTKGNSNQMGQIHGR